MSNSSSWRTLLFVALAAFGMAVFRLSAETPANHGGNNAPCKMKRVGAQHKP